MIKTEGEIALECCLFQGLDSSVRIQHDSIEGNDARIGKTTMIVAPGVKLTLVGWTFRPEASTSGQIIAERVGVDTKTALALSLMFLLGLIVGAWIW